MSITLLEGELSPIAPQAAPAQHVKRFALALAKALVSIGLIALLATSLDYGKVLSYSHRLEGRWPPDYHRADFAMRLFLRAGHYRVCWRRCYSPVALAANRDAVRTSYPRAAA
jgi:hypothetical protein